MRCWLFFRKEEDLEVHLSVVDNICEVRIGDKPEVDGVLPSIEKKLRSRKCLQPNEEDRWRDVYSVLFPGEDIPTPCKCLLCVGSADADI